MKIGIANEETWNFLHDVYADLCQHHLVSVFKRRTTRWPVFRERRDRFNFKQDLRQFLRQNDVVFFEWASELLVSATQLPKTCGIVTRLHRYEMYQWVDLVNWDKVDKVILVSKAKQNEFIEILPLHAAKTEVINVAVPLDKFTYQPHLFSGDIGTLCHLMPRKRVYELILDFYELLQELKKHPVGKPAFHLHIGGDIHNSQGDYFKAMQDLIKALNIHEQVTFYGKVTNTWDWYHNLDIFISNSYSEGLQVALMEAMASGCYCLSHHWTGAEEMLPPENLYYTSNELQEKIIKFVSLSEDEKMAQKSHMRDLAQTQFNIEDNKRRVREVIEQAGVNYHGDHKSNL